MSAKEIRNKIKSVKSTQKITRAMEMVAASKMRKAQDRMRASRPYHKRVRQVISHLVKGRLEYTHPYMEDRTPERIGYVVVSTDRGLCGGLNSNLFKTVVKDMQQWHDQKKAVDVFAIGKKADFFFARNNAKMLGSVHNLGDAPAVSQLVGAVKVMLDAYMEGEIDHVYIAYNEFITTMTQKPRVELLLPIMDTEEESDTNHWDYIYEPDAQTLLNRILERYIESLIYQAAVENAASEQAARMVAMKSASDNAGDLIEQFELLYNKARQAAITQELSEIVSGAAAV